MALHHQGHDADARRLLEGVADQFDEANKPYLDKGRKLLGE